VAAQPAVVEARGASEVEAALEELSKTREALRATEAALSLAMQEKASAQAAALEAKEEARRIGAGMCSNSY